MKSSNKTMSPDRINLIFVGFITAMGLIVRIAIPLISTFPLNDGGLFYQMILDLESNHLLLPITTTYNSASIPFAYPPLAFYLYALMHITSGVPIIDLIRLLPAIISTASIPAFYLLAGEMLESKTQALLATLIFALLPRAFDWLIMGGGVTRSLGLLFALLAMRQAYILFTTRSLKAALAMVLFGALVVYTHPEATTHTVLSAIFFYLWKDRSRKGFFLSLLVGFGILLITAPWWATVFSRFGVSPFLAAANAARQDSSNAFIGLFALFQFQFADEPYLGLLSVLGLVGIFYLLAKKSFFLPLWFVIMHTFEPRGGPLFMMIPLAMFAGIGLDNVILPAISNLNTSLHQSAELKPDSVYQKPDQLLNEPGVKLFIGFVFLYGFMAAYSISLQIKQQFTLTDADLQAFNWVTNNTMDTDQFALITNGVPLRDSISEWFPALTKRQSVATVFGFEWINDGKFAKHTEDYQALQECAYQNISCLDNWMKTSGKKFTYVFIHATTGNKIGDMPLTIYLLNSPAYQSVYATDEIEIFHRK